MRALSREDAVAKLRKAGVVDGKSGQPVYHLLKGSPGVLIVNAYESQPFSLIDTLLLTREGRRIEETLRLLREVFEFNRVVVAVNEWSEEEVVAFAGLMERAGFEMAAVPSGFAKDVEAHLVHTVTGRFTGAAGPAAGVAVLATESIYHAWRALVKNRPQVTTFVQMAGEVEKAYVFEAPLGAYAEDLAAIAREEAGQPPKVHAITLGPGETSAVTSTSPTAGGDRRLHTVQSDTESVLVLGDEGDLEFLPEYALETLTPVDRILDVTDRVRRGHLSLQPRLGVAPTVRVKAGDLVPKDGVLAAPENPASLSVPLHAPFACRIERVDAYGIDFVAAPEAGGAGGKGGA